MSNPCLCRRLRAISMLLLLACWQIGQPLHAATFYWDGGNANIGTNGDGASAGGSGTWNTTLQNWDAGTPPHVAWGNTSLDTAVFGGTAGTVTINTGAGITANRLTFDTDGYIINSSLAADVLILAGTTPTITVTTAGHTATVDAVVAGTAGLTKAGAGTLVLNGANTYTGTTTISTGTVKLGSASALGSSAAADYTVVADGATLDLNGQTIAEAFGTNVAGGDGFAGAAGILTNSSATAAAITGIINSDGGSTFIVNGTGDITLDRVARTSGSSGSPTITKTGGNTLILAGTADNAAASVTVNGGVVQLNKGGSGVRALGGASSIGVNGTLRLTTGQTNGDQIFSSVDLTNNGTFDLQGQDESFNAMTGTGLVTNGATNNASLLTLGENNSSFTWGGVIQDGAGTSTLSLTKTGTGTMTITNTNTYTGATQISGSGGTLTLDFATAIASSNLISSASSMTMNNASVLRTQTLTITGDATQVTSQTFNGTNVNGLGARHRIVATSGTGGTTLALGAFSLASGAFVDFVLPASGSITATNADTILGPGATLNNGAAYAQILGGQVVAFSGDLIYQTGINISALSGYTVNGHLAVTAASTGNVLQAAGTTALNTVSFTDTAARILTLGAGNTLQLGATGGILRSAAAGIVTIGDAVNSGTLTTGTAAGADLILTNGNATGTLTINSVIADNIGGAVDVFANGAAAAVTLLAGANTYTGTTTVQTGTLRVANDAGLGSVTGGTSVMENAALELSGGITIGDEALTIFGTGVGSTGALRNFSGTNTYGGLVTIAASTTEIQAESGSTLIFDRAGSATPSMTTPGNITLEAVGTAVITFNDALVTTGSGNPTITKTGAGTLNFNAANTWVGSGAFTISGGIVRISNGGALGGSTGVTIIQGNTTAANRGSLELIGGITTDESITIDSGSAVNANGAIRNISGDNFITGIVTVDNGNGRINSDAGTLTLSGATALRGDPSNSANRSVSLGGAANISITGIVTNGVGSPAGVLSLSKDGTGTLILSGANAYTGTTAITAGTVVATSSTALGTGTGANVTLSAGAGLNYFAATDTALTIGGTLAITSGAGTTIGGSIGATATSAQILVTGNATSTTGAVTVNISGITGVSVLAGTNNYTLIHGNGAGSSLNNATYTLGTIYNNTNFTVGAITKTASDVFVSITAAAPVTAAYWTGGLSGAANVWSASNGTTASNWVTSAAGGATALIPSTAADVTISASTVVTAPTATVLGANMGIKTLTIADTTNGLGLNADGFTLTITPGSGSTGITMDALVPASTIAANVALGAAQTWTNNSANALTVSGIVSGAFNLMKAGSGSIVLSGPNTLSGGITLSAGTLVAANSLALGAATNNLTLAGGTLDLASDISTTAHNTAVTGNTTILSNRGGAGVGITHTLGTLSIGAQTLSIAAGGNVTGGTAGVTFGATTIAASGSVFDVAAGSLLTIAGIISGGTASNSTQAAPGANTALTIKGAGSVTFSNTGNTFNGDIVVDGGGINVDNVRDWGSVTVAGSTSKTITLINGGRFNLTSGTLNPGATNTTSYTLVQIGSGGGTIDIASGATLQLDDTGQLFGSGTLTKTGAGTLALRNQSTFTGQMIIAAGTLQPIGGTGSNLGTTGAGTIIQSGAAFNLNGISITEAEPMTISGTGVAANPAGVITNSSGTSATFLGPITLAGHSTIGAAAGGAMTLSGGISGAYDLTIRNLAAGGTTLSTNAVNNGGTITNAGPGAGATTISAAIGSSVTSIIQNSATSAMTLSNASIAFNGAVNVLAGTLNITGGSTTAPTLTSLAVAGGGTLGLVNGAGQAFNLAAGVIQLGTGTGSGTATLSLELGSTAAYDRFLSSSAAVTANNIVINVTGLSGFGVGNYDLLTAASGLDTASYSIGTIGGASLAGTTLSLVTAPTFVRLVSAASTGNFYWDGALNLSWLGASGLNTNWSSDLAGDTNAQGTPGLASSVIFSSDDMTATSMATTLDAAFSIKDLTFNGQTGTGPLSSISIASGTGGSLTITPTVATAGINVLTGAPATISLSAPIILGANQTWTVVDAATVLNSSGGISGTGIGLTKAGAGTLHLTGTNSYTGTTTVSGGVLRAGVNNAFAQNSAHVVNGSGILQLNNFTIAIGSLAGSGTVENGAGGTGTRTLTVGGDNSSTLFSGVLQDGGPFGLALTKVGTGTMTLSGVSTYTGNTTVTGGTLIFASGASSTTAKLLVGIGSGLAAAIIQKAGSTLAIGTSLSGQDVLSLGGGANGYGYYLNEGGTLSTGQLAFVGNTAGANVTGVFEQRGGSTTVTAAGGYLIFGWQGTNSNSVLNIFDGTVTNNSTINDTQMGFAANAGSFGLLNLLGANALLNATANGSSRGVELSRNMGNFAGVLNLNSGTLLTNFVKAASAGTPSFLNFDGGILKANSANTSFVTGLTAATIYAGGATIDTNGVNVTLPQALLAPTGNGITSIAVADGGAGYIGAPAVRITGGGGTGATAIAEVDLDPLSANYGKVTGIRITSPGTGYTSAPTVTLYGGGSTTAATVGTAATGANTSGGLTKTGIGTLTLTGANTYTGGTRILAGTLALGASNVLENSGVVIVDGGTFDVVTFSETVGAVTLKSGGITGSTGVLTGTSYTLESGMVNFTGTGGLGGSASVVKTTTGTVTLNNNGLGSFANAVQINDGTLAFFTSAQLGNASATNTITLGGGKLQFAAFNTTVDLMANRVVTLTGGTTSTIDVVATNSHLQLTGGISSPSAASLVKTGGGSLTVTGPVNLNGGNLTMAQGTLAVTGAVNLNGGNLTMDQGTFTVAGAVSLDGGNLTLTQGNLTVAGPLSLGGGNLTVVQGTYTGGLSATGTNHVSISAGGALLLVDSTAVVSTLAGALTINGGARMGFELGAPGTNDSIISTLAAVTTPGVITLDFYNLGGLATGTYNLLSASAGGLLGPGVSYVLGNAPTGLGFNYVINQTDTLVSLGVSVQSNRYWTNSQATGSWATLTGGTSSNFSTDLAGTVNAGAIPTAMDTVIFSSTSVGASPVNTTLNAAITIDSLVFNSNPAGGTFSIAPGTGGSLTIAPLSNANGISVGNNGGAVTISAPLTAGTAQTWFVGGTGVSSLTITGNTTFTGNVAKTGAGTLTLSGNNTGAGGITLYEGTLNIGSATALGAGAFTIKAGTTFTNSSAGALTLTTSNAQVWDGGFTFGGTQSLDMGTGAVTLDASLTATIANTLTIGGVIDDGVNTYVLTKAGTGTLVLSGANTFGGGLVLNAGTLVINHAAALGTGIFTINAGTINNTSGSAITLSNNNAQIWNGSFTFTGTNNLNLGTGAVTLGAAPTVTVAANTLTIGGVIAGGFGLTKDGAGTLVLSGLSGTAANNYSGATTVNDGTLNMTTAASLSGGLTFGAAAGSTKVGIVNLPNGATFGGQVLVQTNNVGGNFINLGAGQTLTLNGNVQIGSTTPIAANSVARLTIGGGGHLVVATAAGGVFNVGGSTSSSTTLSQHSILDLTGLATVDINVSFSGTVRVNQPSGGNASGNQATLLLPTPVVAANTLVTTITANNLNIGDNGGNGAGAGQVNTLTLGTGITTLNVNNLNVGTGSRDMGQLNFASGNGSVVLRSADGVGRAAVNVGTGGANTGVAPGSGVTNHINLAGHQADLLISTLKLGEQNRNTDRTDIFTFDTGTLDVTTVIVGDNTGSVSGTVNATWTSILNIGGGTTTIGTGGLDIGRGDTAVSGADTVEGIVNITGGTVTIANNSSTGFAAAVRLGANSIATGLTANGSLNITGGSVTVAGHIIRGNTTGAGSATLTLDGGSLDMSGKNIGAATPTVTFNAQSGTLANVAQINGGAGLTKTAGAGSNTLILEGNNTYTGGTTISSGTLQIGSGGTTGTLGAGDVTNNGTLAVNRSNALTIANLITGTGDLIQAGSGTTTLTNSSNSFTGKTSITGGTLSISAETQLGAAPASPVADQLSLSNGARLQVTASTAFSVNRGVTLGTGGGAIETAVATSTTVNAVITGGGQLTKEGAGTLVLTAANNYSGATNVTAGTLQVGDGTSGSLTGTGSVTVSNANSKLSGSGTIAGSTVIGSGAVLAPGIGSTTTDNRQLIFTAASTAVTVDNGGHIQLSLTSSASVDAAFNWAENNALAYLNTLTSTGTDFTDITYTSYWRDSQGSYDSIKLTNGTFTLGSGGSTVQLLNNSGSYALGSIFKLLDWNGLGTTSIAGSGSFTTAADLDLSGITLAPGLGWDTSAFANYGVIVVVPEPSRSCLLLLALGFMLFQRRRSRRSSICG